MKDMSFHFPLLLPLVNANVCEILFFPFTLYRAISFFMSLTISITLNSFVHCVSLLCSRFTSSISFTTSFKTTYSLPSLCLLHILLPISTCCARMCFKNLFQFNKQEALKSIGWRMKNGSGKVWEREGKNK